MLIQQNSRPTHPGPTKRGSPLVLNIFAVLPFLDPQPSAKVDETPG